LAVVAYWPALGSEFHFDDYALFSDPAVTLPAGPLELFGPERTRPLTYLTFWANYQLHQTDPLGYHGVNILLLAALAWLAGALFERLVGPQAAPIALAVFILHPLQTEAVAYVFGRAVILAALFSVLAFRSWLERRLWRALAWFSLAMLSKEEAAALPLLLAGYDWFFTRPTAPEWKQRAAPLAAMGAIVALAATKLLIAARDFQGAGAIHGLGEITPWTYLLTQGRAIWLYLRLLVAPVGLNFDRDFSLSTGLDAPTLIAWAALALTAAACLYLARRAPAFYWILGGFILLAPTSSIAPLADLAVERRMFLPLLSFSLALGSLAASALRRRASLAVAALAAITLCGMTYARCLDWRTEESLWRDTLAKSPAKIRPKLQLARALEVRGPSGVLERRRLLDQALVQSPDDAEALGEYGMFHLQQRRPLDALELFERARAQSPSDPQIVSNIGTAQFMLGNSSAAKASFRRALAIDPCNFDARNNLILALKMEGLAAEARRLLDRPDNCPFSAPQLQSFTEAQQNF
jgi:Tfp pilus assembly protein PilF